MGRGAFLQTRGEARPELQAWREDGEDCCPALGGGSAGGARSQERRAGGEGNNLRIRKNGIADEEPAGRSDRDMLCVAIITRGRGGGHGD